MSRDQERDATAISSDGRLPAERYFSTAWMNAEWERMWTRVWLLTGHVSQLARPGDFFTTTIGRESVLVTRGEDGVARAFYNVCQHRGNTLCTVEAGHATSFRCAYHHWEWSGEGALRSAPRAALATGGGALPSRPGAPLVPERCRLPAIACQERLGFLWLHFDRALAADGALASSSIDLWLDPVASLIAPYRPEQMTLTGNLSVEIACNWKTSSDVNNEAYHLRTLHHEMLQVLDDDGVRVTLLGRHSRLTIPLGRASAGTPWQGTIAPHLRGLLEREGAGGFRGGPDEVRGALRSAVRTRALRDGVDLGGLDDDQLVDKHQFYLFPNVQLNFTARSLELYRHLPHPSLPEVCFFDEQRLDRRGPSAPPLPPAPHHRLRHGERSLGPVMDQDVDLLPGLQAGMRSRGFPGLLLTEQESCIAHMHRELDRWLREVD